MRPRNQTSAPPVAKPAPLPQPAPRLATPQPAPSTSHRAGGWNTSLIRVAIVNENGCGVAGAGDGTEGWSDGTPEHVVNPKTIPLGGFAAICGSLVAKQAPRIELIAVVDDADKPRPDAFTPPFVHATVRFRPARWKAPRTVFEATSVANYAGPGQPLGTSFSSEFPFTPPGPGTLFVSLAQSDPDTGAVADVSAEIPVEPAPEEAPTPTPAPAFDDSAVPIGVWLNVPDPVNAPLEYRPLGKEEHWRSDDETVEVWHDSKGYYYIGIVGNKVRLPGKP